MARAGLDREAVLAAATAIADAEGLDAVTLAGLARALGVKTPSLYNHVPSLGALQRDLALAGMREANARMTRAAVGLAREDALVAVGLAYRDFARERPGLYAASLRAAPAGDAELQKAGNEVVGTVLAVLSGYGLTGDDALHATRGLRATGTVAWFIAAISARRCASIRVPAFSRTSPAEKSTPARRMLRPSRAGSSSRTASAVATADSCTTTASAPSGTGAPVRMRTASPAPTTPAWPRPAALTPTSFSVTGALAASAERTA